MATSGRGRGSSLVGEGRRCVLVTRWIALLRGRKEELAESAEDAMADRGHSTLDCRCAG